MSEFGHLSGPQRRRSPRLTSPPQANANVNNGNTAQTTAAIKRSITVRKIAPRKTVAPSEHDKENTPSRPGSECGQQTKLNVSTPDPVTDRGLSSSAKQQQQQQQRRRRRSAAMPSPILPSSPPPSARPQPPPVDPEDAVWTQKVRRSYSRLSDKSLNGGDPRETLFGFEELRTPEVSRRAGPVKAEVSGPASALSSFASLLEADDCGAAAPEPDTNIPGVAVVKEKRRRRKVQQIDESELDAMAAKMNAEFREAEGFELVVE